MRFYLLVIIGLCFFSATGVLNLLTKNSSPVHQACLKQVPKEYPSQNLLSSLVCGKSLSDQTLKKLLINASLIHLIVVSGSHFIVILFFLRLITKNQTAQGLVIFLYWITTKAQAPGLLAFLLWSLQQKTALSLKTHQKILCAGLGCLLIQPNLMIQSASLYLSWLCGLGLCFAMSTKKSNWLTTQLIFYFLINCFGGWTEWMHPFCILFNLSLGVFLSVILFPLGIFVVVTHIGQALFEKMTEVLVWILTWMGPESSQRDFIWNEKWWLFIITLQISLAVWDLHKSRHELSQELGQRQG